MRCISKEGAANLRFAVRASRGGRPFKRQLRRFWTLSRMTAFGSGGRWENSLCRSLVAKNPQTPLQRLGAESHLTHGSGADR